MNKPSTTKPMGASEDKREPIGEQAKGLVSNVASTVKEGVSNKLDVRKEKTVETIDEVADAVRKTGKKLDAGPIPELAERAANGIDRVARFFESAELKDVIGNVERFARREPALFLGGAVALGLVAGRFLKSSSSSGSGSGFSSDEELHRSSERYEDYDDEELLDEGDIEEEWDVGARNVGMNTSDLSSREERTTDPMGFTGRNELEGSTIGPSEIGSSSPKGRL